MSVIKQKKLSPFSRNVWLAAGLFALLAMAFFFYTLSERQNDRAEDQKYQSFLLADELRQSSDDLTRMVRTYVVTGDPLYKKYYQDILDIRNGKKPRPGGYQNIYWDLVLRNEPRPHPDSGRAIALLELMRQAGFTEQEFQKLAEAKSNSDGLTAMEFEAMRLVETQGPEAEASRARARRMMYDDKYHQAKAAIMKPIDEFFALMEQRTSHAVQATQIRATIFRIAFIFFGLSLMGMLLRTNKILHTIMGGSVDEVYRHITRIGRGDFSFAIPVTDDMKNSVLGQLAEMQTRLGKMDHERKQAEIELRKFQRAIEQSPATVVVTDLTGAIEYVNPKFTETTGYTREEAFGKNPRILKSGELPDKAYKELWETITSGKEWRGEFHNKKKNGELYWEFASISPVRGSQGAITHFLAVKEDITERKRAEEEMKQKVEELERFNKIAVGRELKMIELKEKIKALEEGKK